MTGDAADGQPASGAAGRAEGRPSRALVLGGGGVTGIAWEVGVLAGLHDGGIDVADWDLVVGTSAGSIVGARLLGGDDIEAYFAEQAAAAGPTDHRHLRQVGGMLGAAVLRLGRRRAFAWLPAAYLAVRTVETLVRDLLASRPHPGPLEPLPHGFRAAADPEALLVRLGRISLAARTAAEAVFLDVVGVHLGSVRAWPVNLVVTATDAATGTTVGIDGRSEVPVVRAVAASCAVPGLMPSVDVRGRAYLDGGMASQTHAGLALGHDEVVVVAPLDWGRLAGEADALRGTGTQVTLITPSDAASRAIGRAMAVLDPVRRAAAATAGRRDGREAADRVAAARADAVARRASGAGPRMAPSGTSAAAAGSAGSIVPADG